MEELKQEVQRLREMVKALESERGVRTARCEFSETGHLIITAPGMDEMQFGSFVAAQLALMVNTAGILNIATGEPTVTP